MVKVAVSKGKVNAGMGTVVVVTPVRSVIVWPGAELTVNVEAPSVTQSGVQNLICKACAVIGDMTVAVISKKTILELRMFLLPCLVT